MNKTEYVNLICEGWAPPEEVSRLNKYIEELENKCECPQCGRILQPKRCEHCDGEPEA